MASSAPRKEDRDPDRFLWKGLVIPDTVKMYVDNSNVFCEEFNILIKKAMKEMEQGFEASYHHDEKTAHLLTNAASETMKEAVHLANVMKTSVETNREKSLNGRHRNLESINSSLQLQKRGIRA